MLKQAYRIKRGPRLLFITFYWLFSVFYCESQIKKTLFMIDHPASMTDVQLLKDTHITSTYSSLNTLVDVAHSYFSGIPVNYHNIKPMLVILDIDDTAITCVHNKKISGRKMVPRRVFEPIKPIFDLYQTLRALNFKIAFVTWRIDTPTRRKATEQHLKQCGYHCYESLHMRPESWQKSRSEYKQSARQLLAQSYDIVATIDDKLDNLSGTNTGDFLIWINQQ